MTEPTPNEPTELADAVRTLRGTVDALRADVKRIGASGALPSDEPEPTDRSWVTTVSAPVPRRPAIPRFLLEAIFLASCAVASAIAELEPVVIAGVMAGAWALVALIEWAASRADRYAEELLYAPPPVPSAPAAPAADPAWFSPPVEQTMIALDENGATAVTQLPPRLADPGETMEHRPDDLVDPMGDTSASIGEATGMLGRVERSALDDTQH